MKHLLALLALLLTAVSAHAQTAAQVPVTKLPGEEALSVRERAERDFLMPVRRKKVAPEPPKTIGEEVTAAPETDGTTTAHFAEASDEARSEEAAPAREAHVAHTHAVRHTAHHSSTRSHKATKAKTSRTHSAKKSSSHKTKAKAKTTHAKAGSSKKSSTHKSAKKASAHKATSKKKHRR